MSLSESEWRLVMKVEVRLKDRGMHYASKCVQEHSVHSKGIPRVPLDLPALRGLHV